MIILGGFFPVGPTDRERNERPLHLYFCLRFRHCLQLIVL
jgi:hypothetical protein